MLVSGRQKVFNLNRMFATKMYLYLQNYLEEVKERSYH